MSNTYTPVILLILLYPMEFVRLYVLMSVSRYLTLNLSCACPSICSLFYILLRICPLIVQAVLFSAAYYSFIRASVLPVRSVSFFFLKSEVFLFCFPCSVLFLFVLVTNYLVF